MSTLTFSAKVDEWVGATKARAEAVFQTAAERLGEAIIEGTPVDTGFLRHSFQASAAGIPPLVQGSAPPPSAKAGTFTYDAGPVNLIISNVQIGGTIYFGFTAGYAGHVEYGANGRPGRAMVRLAAQRWPQIVADTVRDAKTAAGAR